MTDQTDDAQVFGFQCEYAKSGRSKCKNSKCGDPEIEEGSLRCGKLIKASATAAVHAPERRMRCRTLSRTLAR